MLRALVISPDQMLNQRLEEIISQVGMVGIVRTVDHYPNELELLRVVRACGPHIVFLNADALPSAVAVAAVVESKVPGLQMAAISRTCEPQVLLELMRLGIREFLSLPFRRQVFHETIVRLKESAAKKPPAIDSTNLLFAFLPSKPGVGTSTISLNTSMALSRLPDTDVLLSDLDLNSGMIRFMLKLDNPYSIADAAEHAATIDENLWPQLVSSLGRMDVLHAGKLNPGMRIESTQIRYLLEFARRHYRAICMDLSGNMEKYSVEIMHESKRVFIVCTPEIASLHLAREKLMFLRSLDLGDRVSLLLNRCQKRMVVTPAQIQELLGLPVHMTFPNDYAGVHKALTAGKNVDPKSELGSQFTRLARSLVENKSEPIMEPKKRFIEYFSLFPKNYSILPDGKKTAV